MKFTIHNKFNINNFSSNYYIIKMYSINNINNYILLLYILIDDFSAEQWLITIN